MKIKNPSLERVAVHQDQYPPDNMPEYAFVGRSNVGKSSLINSLVGRRALARTSSKPGKTRTINFYNIDGKFRMVDLPGYGYAAVSQAEKERWADTINEYLAVRENLKEVILLVDIRHKPSRDDVMMYDWILAAGFTGYVIATKLDKIGKSRLQKYISDIKNTLDVDDRNKIIYYSATTKENRDYVYKIFESE